MKNKYEELSKYYEGTDDIQECIFNGYAFKNKTIDNIYYMTVYNTEQDEYILCSIYMDKHDFKDYFSKELENFTGNTKEEWENNSDLYKIQDINIFYGILQEQDNYIGEFTEEQLVKYLLKLAS